jgi:thymidine phosphorylase
MFQLRRMGIDTQSEHVVFIDERAVREGALGLNPLDRVRVIGRREGEIREIQGILNFCHDSLLEKSQVGLSEVAFLDLDLAPDSAVEICLARPPQSVDLVREKLRGRRLARSDFDEILGDVVARRYSKPELSMFVLACALQNLDEEELIAFTRAMIACGSSLEFEAPIVADKHCIGGIPGNRTTMVIVPILASLGVPIPKTSSRAITSPSGTADTMGVLANVELGAREIHRIVGELGGCICWGGALDLAPADDVLITVERPMQIDTEAQMVASILAKKKTAGATHALIDIPIGPTAKVRSEAEAESLTHLFQRVAGALDLHVDVVVTDARAPIGRGVGPCARNRSTWPPVCWSGRARHPMPRAIGWPRKPSIRGAPRRPSSGSSPPRASERSPRPRASDTWSRRATTVASDRSTASRSRASPSSPARPPTSRRAFACCAASGIS